MKLFYSYSHKDEEFRDELENHLSELKQGGYIEGWHDRKILPGEDFQQEIDQNLEKADIIALLISSNFLASDACKQEMYNALDSRERKGVTVIPIIVRSCDWKSSDIGKLQALPKNGKAISKWPDRDDAFLNVARGIKTRIMEMVKLQVRSSFRAEVSEIEFISGNTENIQLQDIFVFPHIVKREDDSEIPIHGLPDIWNSGNHYLLRGDDRSGKTIICRKIFLERVDNDEPTLFLSGHEIRGYKHEELIRRKFKEEFDGCYDLWKKRSGKMVIIDDFHIESGGKFLDSARHLFDYVFITMSDNEYLASYSNQSFLSKFYTLDLRPLKHAQQEKLIRKWKNLGCSNDSQATVADSAIDRFENIVNAMIFRNKIVPRFPFYVLSILQAYEGFMPQNLQVTVYGHCYQVLIVAQLMDAGIKGEDLDSAINFLSFFAFDLYKNDRHSYDSQEFLIFLDNYRNNFVIKKSTMDRLMEAHKPIIKIDNGVHSFRHSFVYYYLLGYYLARNMDACKNYIEDLTKKSYLRDNTFTLIFTIHHSHDDDLINDILLYTMDALGEAGVATLDRKETRFLEDALREIPAEILTKKPVEEARKEERDSRDIAETYNMEREDDHTLDEPELNDVYRVLKNMEILGQILTNKYGSLSKQRAKEIITTVSDAGLRLVRLLTSKKRLLEFEDFIIEKVKDMSADHNDNEKLKALRKAFRALVIILVYALILKTSTSVGRAELSEVIREVANEQDTTGYKLIDLFSSLNAAHEVDEELANQVANFLKECKKDGNGVVKRIVSLEVQRYCNTHNVDYKVRQRLLGELGLRYRPNIVGPR